MKKRLVLIIFLIIVALLSCMFVGCKTDNAIEQAGIESGFTISSGEPQPPIHIGYKADVREFDIDKVELEIFFGWERGLDYDGVLGSFDYELVLENILDRGKYYPIKDISDFNDMKYTFFYNLENNQIEYSYSEKLIIPKEIFLGETGEVYIKVNNKSNQISNGGFDSFLYTKIGDNKVRIDEWWTKYTEIES